MPMSPKKPKVARVGTGHMPGMASKVRELRELSTGSRSMPVLPDMAQTPTKTSAFGTPRHHGLGAGDPESATNYPLGGNRVRSVEEKKEILGGMLGNVDALVEGVRKAGVWGLG